MYTKKEAQSRSISYVPMKKHITSWQQTYNIWKNSLNPHELKALNILSERHMSYTICILMSLGLLSLPFILASL